MPHPPFSPDLDLSDFFFDSLDEKSLQRETFANVEEVKKNKTKLQEHLKGIKINEFKNHFEQWKKILTGVL